MRAKYIPGVYPEGENIFLIIIMYTYPKRAGTWHTKRAAAAQCSVDGHYSVAVIYDQVFALQYIIINRGPWIPGGFASFKRIAIVHVRTRGEGWWAAGEKRTDRMERD